MLFVVYIYRYKDKILLCHEGNVDCLPVELGGVLGGLGDVAAVHQPKSETLHHTMSDIIIHIYY